MDLLDCCFNIFNINPRRLATAFHSLYQEVHTISPLYFEEIIAGISKHGLVNFADLKQNITLTIDDWEAGTQEYAKNTLNLKNNLYDQIVETETGANLVGMYNNFQSCSQEYAQEVKTTGDISGYHLCPLVY